MMNSRKSDLLAQGDSDEGWRPIETFARTSSRQTITGPLVAIGHPEDLRHVQAARPDAPVSIAGDNALAAFDG